uniref:Movement protein n=1 Tax=Cnidium virus 2 TaxID=3057102 RepID=A0AA96PZM0_9RHAB|nr:MAG: movement protein [Cnidium virus 2]
MESHMTVVTGEFVAGQVDGVISLSKKIGLFNRILTKFGYTNIAIREVMFSFKSRCASQALGTMKLRLMDRRLEDPDDQYIDGIAFDVKDWITFSWNYPCWFHYKDFEVGDKDLIEVEWDIERSNMVDSISVGHYKVKITYAMQNEITRLKSVPNVAAKVHTQVSSSKFLKKSKTGRVYKSADTLLNVSNTPNREALKGTKSFLDRKEELLTKSMGSLFPPR